MKKKRTKLILSAVALLIAIAAAGYYYTGWPDFRYLTADPQTRQRLDTEKLQMGYKAQAKAFEQEFRPILSTDTDIRAKIDAYNSVVLNARQKYMDMMKDIVNEANAFAAKHSRRSINMEDLHVDPKGILPDSKLMKEIRLDSVSESPASIHTDSDDLLQRYRADLSLNLSLVMLDGNSFPSQERFVATANPQKKWNFPSVTEVKQRILAGLDDMSRTVENGIEMTLNKQKLELESMLHKMELETLQRD